MTIKPKTRKAPATCINPKLIALAAKADPAETELKRVLTDVREPADLRFFANREDEGAACDASGRAAEKFSKVRATNLQELILKARHADVNFIDDVVALSIVGDLLAIGGKP
jgi:hypothetical protein